jgi:monothiol glutaredoxin
MTENSATDRIKNEITENDIVLFMKGSPMFPQCGFSAAVAGAFTSMKVKFKGIDVLEDNELRQGIKDFSNWPTIPQVYLKGEFLGGCDIIKEMHESGELQELFVEKNIEFSVD